MLHTRREEEYNPTSLTQEVGEMVAMALNKFRRQPAQENGKETFLLSIHGTKLRLATACITRESLSLLQPNQMPASHELYVRRLKFFDIINPGDRVEALRMCIGLLKYIADAPRIKIEQTRASEEIPRLGSSVQFIKTICS